MRIFHRHGRATILWLIATVLGVILTLPACSSSDSGSRVISSTKQESEGVVVLISPTEQAEYWKNGKLKARWEVENRNGEFIRHGTSTNWHWNGSILMTGEYVDGKETGTWKYWNNRGTIVLHQVFDNGEPIYRILFFDDGSKEAEGPLLDGEPHGVWKEWGEGSTDVREVTYEHGEVVE